MATAENYVVRFDHPNHPETNIRIRIHLYEKAAELFWKYVIQLKRESVAGDAWELSMYTYDDKDSPSNRSYIYKFNQME